VLIGFQIHKQAHLNFNTQTEIEEFTKKLNSISELSSGINLVIQENISDYNKKIAYAKLLNKFNLQDFTKVQNSEILKLKDSYKISAGKSFAVQEYGTIIIVLTAIFSIGLTMPLFWLVFCVLIFIWTAGINYLSGNGEPI
jgi:hypothetical protein